MSKLILHMITSVDGFLATEAGEVNPETRWDEETQRYYLDLFTGFDGIVFGRNLYDQYVGHWSKVADGQIASQTGLELRWAQRLMAMDKYVCSNTVSSLPDATILSGDVATSILKLKQAPGRDLLLMCGPALFAYLNDHGLIDEYLLYVCPNALGRGKHLFANITAPVSLHPATSRRFPTGVEMRSYRPGGVPQGGGG